MANAVALRQGSSGAATAWRIAGFTVGAIFVGFVLANIPDIVRYIRISNM